MIPVADFQASSSRARPPPQKKKINRARNEPIHLEIPIFDLVSTLWTLLEASGAYI